MTHTLTFSPPGHIDGGGPVVLGAAMGTRLIARGLDLRSDDPCLWSLQRPEVVLDVHLRDIRAGADALLTNTFGANEAWLGRFGRGQEMRALQRASVALAREAAGPGRWVIGGLGPTSGASEAVAVGQAAALAEAGVDALLIETVTTAGLADRLTAWLASVGPPVLVSLLPSAWKDGAVLNRGLACRLFDRGARVVGCNCGALLETVELWEALGANMTGEGLAVPSGQVPGGPIDGPERFAEAVPRLRRVGVRWFGGCCGTTEAHVSALRAAVDRSIDVGADA